MIAACAESALPSARRFPFRSCTTRSSPVGPMSVEKNSTSVSRIASTRQAPSVARNVRTYARFVFQAMSIRSPSSASTCAS